MKNGKTDLNASEIRDLIDQAVTLSGEYGADVEEAVAAAVEQPLDAKRAMRLYVRVLEILRDVDSDAISDKKRARLVSAIRKEAAIAVDAVERPEPTESVTLVERNGLQPRPVAPTPMFNETAIPMQEGYVDIEQLRLWQGNHRLELQVSEFREKFNREPDGDELVKIMHGAIHLPSQNKNDPFSLAPLAQSIARKGVERPPIITCDGVPKDGNRRLAASLMVVHGKEFTDAQKERARYIRVWQAPESTTEDQFDAIVVSQNFESDHKEDWPEYIKARLVVDQFDERREAHRGRITTAEIKKIKDDVAKRFAIKVGDVTRYIKMVRWAEDFETYHVDAGKTNAAVRYKADDIFQWFYELDAGKGEEKLTSKLDNDDDLKTMVYEMMFDLLDSGAQVRSLHKVLNDADATQQLQKAYEMMGDSPEDALDLVDEAIALAKRKSAKRRSVGFDQFLKTLVDRLGATPPDQWSNVESDLLVDVRRVFQSALGSIEGQATARRAGGEEIAE